MSKLFAQYQQCLGCGNVMIDAFFRLSTEPVLLFDEDIEKVTKEVLLPKNGNFNRVLPCCRSRIEAIVQMLRQLTKQYNYQVEGEFQPSDKQKKISQSKLGSLQARQQNPTDQQRYRAQITELRERNALIEKEEESKEAQEVPKKPKRVTKKKQEGEEKKKPRKSKKAKELEEKKELDSEFKEQ